MKITEEFIEGVLKEDYPDEYQKVYDNSLLLQYFSKKMKAIHGDSKARRSLANIYAVYAILHFYQLEFYMKPDEYRLFMGYEYSCLLRFCRQLYGGSKLQNHALNSRVNGEFHNKFKSAKNDLIIANNGKYLLHIEYLYVDGKDISKTCCRLVEKYIELIMVKDCTLIQILREMQKAESYEEKRIRIIRLLSDDAEARVFEIISYAILKNHYKNTTVYFGYTADDIHEYELELYKTGRTNANDGGIDFVMRPIGRFFQVTEVNDYDKYLLDIDKVMHFPITFVVKTRKSQEAVLAELDDYICQRANGMIVIERRYREAIEDVITINELQHWVNELGNDDIDSMIRDIDIYYRMEMNFDDGYDGDT